MIYHNDEPVTSLVAEDEFTIDCEANGNPFPELSVFINGKELVPPQTSNISLEMEAAEGHNGALIECFARNSQMEAPEVSSLTLEVLCKCFSIIGEYVYQQHK